MNDVGLGSAGLGEVVDVPVDLTGVRLDPHLTQPAIAHYPVLVVTNEPLEGNKNEMKGSAQFVKVNFSRHSIPFEAIGRFSIVPERCPELLHNRGMGPFPEIVGSRHIGKVVLLDEVSHHVPFQLKAVIVPIPMDHDNNQGHEDQIVGDFSDNPPHLFLLDPIRYGH